MPLYFLLVLVGVIYVFIFVVCLINIINPRYLWETFESWKAKSEPMDAYFKTRRIGSIIALLLITLIMIGPTIMYLTDK